MGRARWFSAHEAELSRARFSAGARRRAQIKNEQFARKRGGPRGGGARATSCSGTTSRASGSEAMTTRGRRSTTAAVLFGDAAFSRSTGAASLDARSNRSQQSRDLIWELQPFSTTLGTAATGVQQHSFMSRPMAWQKYWAPPTAPSGRASSSAARIGRTRARKATISTGFIRGRVRGIQSSVEP